MYRIKNKNNILGVFWGAAAHTSHVWDTSQKFKVFLLHFFLILASLISPESHFYKLCTHLFFRGRGIKRIIYFNSM